MEKVAVVTGGSRGIGLAISQKFLAKGCMVAVLDVDNEALAEAKKSLNDPKRVLTINCSVASPEQVKSAVDQVVAAFGRIDYLVNNAGIAVFKQLLDTTFEEWQRVLSVNLNGPFICSQLCVPVMLKNGGGSIVNIASISGMRGSTMRVAYGTSKAGIIHLTKQQAVEYGNAGIRVNCVAPGPVETEMAKKHTAAMREEYAATIPLNRYGTVDEIANAVAFLCSDEASYVNGQTLAVDGGFDAAGIGLTALRQMLSGSK